MVKTRKLYVASLLAAILPVPCGVAAQQVQEAAPEWSIATETPDMGRIGEWTVATGPETFKPPAWSLSLGGQYDEQTAGDNQPEYWGSFHRPRAIGMTLKHKESGN